jgi:hypothetical protein
MPEPISSEDGLPSAEVTCLTIEGILNWLLALSVTSVQKMNVIEKLLIINNLPNLLNY